MKYLICVLFAAYAFSAMAAVETSCDSRFGKFVVTQEKGSDPIVEYTSAEGTRSWPVSKISEFTVKEIFEDDVGAMMAKTAGLSTGAPKFSYAKYYNLSDDSGAFGIMSFRDDKGFELGNSILIVNAFAKCK